MVNWDAAPGDEVLPPALAGEGAALGAGMLAAGVFSDPACPGQTPVIAPISTNTQTARVARLSSSLPLDIVLVLTYLLGAAGAVFEAALK